LTDRLVGANRFVSGCVGRAVIAPVAHFSQGARTMKGLIPSVLLILATGAAVAASWETASMRTVEGGLVRVGMPVEAARRELGPALRPGKSGKAGKKTEVWTVRGSDGRYRITVMHGKVAQIVVTPNRD
jgi:hypothetical protein